MAWQWTPTGCVVVQQVRLAAPGFPHLMGPGPLSVSSLSFFTATAFRRQVYREMFSQKHLPCQLLPEAMDIFAKLMQTLLNKKWCGRRVTNWCGLGQKIFVGLCSILVVPLCKTCVKNTVPLTILLLGPSHFLGKSTIQVLGLGTELWRVNI